MVNKDIGQILKMLFNDFCDVIEFTTFIDEFGITQFTEKVVFQKVPCLLCYKNKKAAIKGKASDYITQSVSLLLDRDIDIKTGSVVRVYKGKGTQFVDYQKTGEPAIYYNHQEIQMILRNTNT